MKVYKVIGFSKGSETNILPDKEYKTHAGAYRYMLCQSRSMYNYFAERETFLGTTTKLEKDEISDDVRRVHVFKNGILTHWVTYRIIVEEKKGLNLPVLNQ